MFIKKYKEFLLETNDKSIKHAGDGVDNEKKDADTEKKVEKYLNKESENCPRCGEPDEKCICEKEDYWSTQNYHRAPKLKK